MDFRSFFDADEHFRKTQRKIDKCLLTQKIYLRLNEMMPDFFEIFYQDIVYVVNSFFENVNYQRAAKKIKLSNKSFRKLMDEGLPIILDNYERILLNIQGGHFLGINSNQSDFDCFRSQARELYNQTSRRFDVV